MKIFYTKNFIQDLEKSSIQLTLNKYGFLSNFETSLQESKITSSMVNQMGKTSPFEGYYSFNSIRYGDGLQLSFTVPSDDSSFHVNNDEYCYYQIILFYYTKSSDSSLVKPAFIIFEDRVINEDKYIFRGLKLPTNQNIITIEDFPEINCNLILNESKLSNFLENPYGQEPLSVTSSNPKDGEFVSKANYLEVIYEELCEDKSSAKYLETQYYNKYGIKIY